MFSYPHITSNYHYSQHIPQRQRSSAYSPVILSDPYEIELIARERYRRQREQEAEERLRIRRQLIAEEEERRQLEAIAIARERARRQQHQQELARHKLAHAYVAKREAELRRKQQAAQQAAIERQFASLFIDEDSFATPDNFNPIEAILTQFEPSTLALRPHAHRSFQAPSRCQQTSKCCRRGTTVTQKPAVVQKKELEKESAAPKDETVVISLDDFFKQIFSQFSEKPIERTREAPCATPEPEIPQEKPQEKVSNGKERELPKKQVITLNDLVQEAGNVFGKATENAKSPKDEPQVYTLDDLFREIFTRTGSRQSPSAPTPASEPVVGSSKDVQKDAPVDDDDSRSTTSTATCTEFNFDHTDPKANHAAGTLQRAFRQHLNRQTQTAALRALDATFKEHKAGFTLPSYLVYENFSSSPRLAYGSENHDFLKYEDYLTALLSQIDEIHSGGDKRIKEARKELVKQVQAELNTLDELREKELASFVALSKNTEAEKTGFDNGATGYDVPSADATDAVTEELSVPEASAVFESTALSAEEGNAEKYTVPGNSLPQPTSESNTATNELTSEENVQEVTQEVSTLEANGVVEAETRPVETTLSSQVPEAAEATVTAEDLSEALKTEEDTTVKTESSDGSLDATVSDDESSVVEPLLAEESSLKKESVAKGDDDFVVV